MRAPRFLLFLLTRGQGFFRRPRVRRLLVIVAVLLALYYGSVSLTPLSNTLVAVLMSTAG